LNFLFTSGFETPLFIGGFEPLLFTCGYESLLFTSNSEIPDSMRWFFKPPLVLGSIFLNP